MRAARAARLFFLIQPIRSLFSGVVVAVDVVFAPTPFCFAKDGKYRCQNEKLTARYAQKSLFLLVKSARLWRSSWRRRHHYLTSLASQSVYSLTLPHWV